ncbi:MAG: (2Fe-2S)-binding protein [Desulfurococcales archaeon ex4484_42]|nr:MAG: (2Fe-2S)-binding protein [Desulfurococcales archaeon ex4484_42]
MGKEVRKHPIIICRCRDVTLEDVERVLREGINDIETIKRILGIGMGPCQGRTCIPLLISLLSRRLRKSPEELLIPKVRAPITPLPINLLLKSKEDLHKGEVHGED